MVEVFFNYKGIDTTIIQCNINDIMKDIINKFISKRENINKNVFFLYNGTKINEELTFSQQANEIDNERKIMNVIVYDKDEGDNIRTIIKSNEVICPECQENILINIKNYKVNLNECKNGHMKYNILFEEYEKIQKIDLSKIKCDKCGKCINNIYNNKLYICNSCEMKLCTLCNEIHDKNHNIINYNDKIIYVKSIMKNI